MRTFVLAVACFCISPVHSNADLGAKVQECKKVKENTNLKLGKAFNLLKDGSEAASLDILDEVLSDVQTLRALVAGTLQPADAAGVEGTAVEKFDPVFDKLLINVTLEKNCNIRSQDGDVLSVHFVTKIANNLKTVDSSFHTGSVPVKFQLGTHEFAAWNEGLQGMCKGERRRVSSPAAMAYGSKGLGDALPPDTDVVFEFQLVEMQTSRKGVASEEVEEPASLYDDDLVDLARKKFEAEKARKAKEAEEENQRILEEWKQKQKEKKAAKKEKQRLKKEAKLAAKQAAAAKSSEL